MALARSDDRLDDALAEFHGSLTPDEKARFQALQTVPSAASVVELTAQLDQASVKRSGRCVASRLSALLASVQQFSCIISTFVSSNPAVAALVWGSVEFMLRLANNSFSYFEKLSTFLMSVDRFCPRFAEYQALYCDAPNLQTSLRNFYAEIIRFCTHVCEVLRRPDWLNLVRSAWIPFDTEFGPFKTRLMALTGDVKEEIKLAQARAWHDERKSQEKHRVAISRLVRQNDADHKKYILSRQRQDDLSRRQRLLDRLTTYDHSTAYRQARLKCYPGTAQWIYKKPQFLHWVDLNESSPIWISGKRESVHDFGELQLIGIVGSGKTTLAAGIVAYLYSQFVGHDMQRLYFFCRYNDRTSLEAETIVRSLIRQCLHVETLSQALELTLETFVRGDSTRRRSAVRLLTLALESAPINYLVVDGIDECADSERREVLRILSDVISECSKTVKLVLTSRCTFFEMHFQTPVEPVEITMDGSAIDNDISIYVSGTLETLQKQGDLVIGDTLLASHVQSSLVQGAKSMFLWATLQIEEICYQTCDHDIRKVLQDLPVTLEETYARMMHRIAESRKTDLAAQIFRWVAVAKRPLSLYELQEALSVERYSTHSNPDRIIHDIARVTLWCHGLVVLDEINDEVYFAHPTVQEVLMRTNEAPSSEQIRFSFCDADKFAGEICTTYLNFTDFKTELARRNRVYDMTTNSVLDAVTAMNTEHKFAAPLLQLLRIWPSRRRSEAFIGRQLLLASTSARLTSVNQRQEHPFMIYASEHWLFHSSGFTSKDRIWYMWELLVLHNNNLAGKPWNAEDWESSRRSVFSYALKNDHHALLELLKPEFSSEDSITSMHSAAERGSVTVLNGLLGSSEWRRRKQVDTALHGGAMAGQLDVVRWALALGADADALLLWPSNNKTALQLAVECGHIEILQELLVACIGLEPRSSMIPCSLAKAVENGHHIIVDMLLIAGTNREYIWESLVTGLEAAILRQDHATAELLLHAGADANVLRHSKEALCYAVTSGQVEVVDRLIKSGSSVNTSWARDEFSALEIAAGAGHLDIVKSLLHAGAQVNRVSGGCRPTALQMAVKCKRFDIASVLIAAGANVNAPPVLGYPGVLCEAIDSDCLDMVMAIVSADVDHNSSENGTTNGQRALRIAAMDGRVDVVKILLDAGAVDEILEFEPPSALLRASKYGHIKVLETLLRAHSNLYSTVGIAWTLREALLFGQIESIQQLIAKSADIALFFYSKECVQTLHLVLARPKTSDIAETMLAVVWDIKNTCLPLLKCETPIVKALRNMVDREYATSWTDSARATAWDVAASRGHLDIVRLLLNMVHILRPGAKDTAVFDDCCRQKWRRALDVAERNGQLVIHSLLLDAMKALN